MGRQPDRGKLAPAHPAGYAANSGVGFLRDPQLSVLSRRASLPHADPMKPVLLRLRVLAVPLAWLLALSCMAAVAATLFWRFAGPPPVELPLRHDADPRAAAQRIAGQHPFAGEAPTAAGGSGVVASSRFALQGLATGFAGGSAFALLQTDLQPVEAFVEGEEIVSGVRLKRILADGVEIDRGGVVERLALPGAQAAAVAPIATPQSLPPRAVPPQSN